MSFSDTETFVSYKALQLYLSVKLFPRSLCNRSLYWYFTAGKSSVVRSSDLPRTQTGQ